MEREEAAGHRGSRVSAGMLAKSADGYLTGKARLGYVGAWTPRGTEPRLDPKTAPAVRRAFEMAAAGIPLRQVTAALSAAGLRGTRGGPLGLSTVQRVLSDPYYCGLVRDDAGRYLPGTHEPLVRPELFRRAQRGLAARRC